MYMCYAICFEVTLAQFSIVCVWAIRRQAGVAMANLGCTRPEICWEQQMDVDQGFASRIGVPPSSLDSYQCLYSYVMGCGYVLEAYNFMRSPCVGSLKVYRTKKSGMEFCC